jgi:hypothetical protein
MKVPKEIENLCITIKEVMSDDVAIYEHMYYNDRHMGYGGYLEYVDKHGGKPA